MVLHSPVELLALPVMLHVFLHQRQQPFTGGIQFALLHFAAADGLCDLPVMCRDAFRHLQFQASGHALDAVAYRAPVGHDHAVKAPFLPQHLCQQPRILTGIGAVDFIIGAHQRPRLAALDCALEAGEVDFPQGTFADIG